MHQVLDRVVTCLIAYAIILHKPMPGSLHTCVFCIIHLACKTILKESSYMHLKATLTPLLSIFSYNSSGDADGLIDVES